MQIKSNIGKIYDIVATESVDSNVYKVAGESVNAGGPVYNVAYPQTGEFAGYIARTSYKGISVNGPLTPFRDRAMDLAFLCAYSNYLSQLRSKKKLR